jgi:hypothetical protein
LLNSRSMRCMSRKTNCLRLSSISGRQGFQHRVRRGIFAAFS